MHLSEEMFTISFQLIKSESLSNKSFPVKRGKKKNERREIKYMKKVDNGG